MGDKAITVHILHYCNPPERLCVYYESVYYEHVMSFRLPRKSAILGIYSQARS